MLHVQVVSQGRKVYPRGGGCCYSPQIVRWRGTGVTRTTIFLPFKPLKQKAHLRSQIGPDRARWLAVSE
jgi:hypothetical protein